MGKIKGIDFFIWLLCFIAIISFPFNLFVESENLIAIFQSALKLIYAVFAWVFCAKRHYFQKSSKNVFLFIPFFLVCFSNVIFGFSFGEMLQEIDIKKFLILILVSLSSALAEELVFRIIFFEAFSSLNSLPKIIYSACFFGAMHLLNIFNGFSSIIFAQVLYTIGLGLILGLIFEFTHTFCYIVLFHFCFNLLNQNVYVSFFQVDEGVWFYLVNGGFAIAALLYGAFVFKRLSKKE